MSILETPNVSPAWQLSCFNSHVSATPSSFWLHKQYYYRICILFSQHMGEGVECGLPYTDEQGNNWVSVIFYLESEQITPYAVTWRVGRLEEETSGYTDTWENKGTNSLWRITLSEVHSIHKKGNRFTTPRFSTEIFNLKKITATFSRNSHCFHKLTFLVKYPPWKHSALKKKIW